MSDRKPRKFTGSPGERKSVPLWIGLYGTSGAGKTYSALRLALGIQSIAGGEIGLGDTESGKALHYAGEFKFRHYVFDPPFDPLSYADLLDQMVSDGITTAIIDSASHEHEGPGGVLDMHEAEVDRMMKEWRCSREKANASGWIKPKRQRIQMVDRALRTRLNIIWCFRAQNKIDFKTGRAPVQKGFMPIGGEVLIYMMALRALLLPGSKGHPTWQSEEIGEREMINLPHWAKRMLRDGHPLDEDFGAALARWAKGDANSAPGEAAGDEVHRELLALYDMLSSERQTRLRKAIPSRDAILTLPAERARKGLEVMRRALQEQVEEERANSLREMDKQDPGDGDENGDAPEEP